jgi:hypothetical protein
MITRFKIFENEEVVLYWKVPVKNPWYTAALMKIMNSEEEIERWINSDLTMDVETDYIFLYYRIYSNGNTHWTWSIETGITKENYEYQGEITLTQEDIDKAEIYLAAKQYNL